MSGDRFDDNLSLAQIAIRVGMACALTAALAVGTFFVILFVAGTGWSRRRESSRLRRSSALCEQQSLHVHRIPENAGALHRFGPLRPGRQRAGLFEGCQRLGLQIEFGPRVFDRSGHASVLRLQCVGLGWIAGRAFWIEPGTVAGCPGSAAIQPVASASSGSIASILVSV